MMKDIQKFIKEYGYYIVFLVAFVSTIGSLIFSEIMKFPPCVLCWYQRICMYPLVFLLGLGIWRRDKSVWIYGLPLAVIGLGISIYHNLLYYKILPESTAPCVAGVSCTTKFVKIFGVFDIPLLSLMGFVIITTLLIAIKQSQKHDKRK